MRDHQPVGARQGLQYRRLVPGLQRAQVQHLGLHPLARQCVGGVQRGVNRRAIGHDGRIPAGPGDAGLADLHGRQIVGHILLAGIERLVLHHDHRIGIVDGGAHQPIGIGDAGRAHHLQARDMREPRLQALRMLWPGGNAAAMRQAHHHRHAALATEHEARLGRLIDDGIHRNGDEIHEHDFDHRPQPGHRRAHGGTDDGGFRDRRVAHPVLAISFQQAARHAEGAAGGCDILAEHDHGRIGRHGVRQGLVQRTDVAKLCHRYAPAGV